MTGIISKLVVDKETGASRGFGFIRGTDGAEYFFHRTGLERTTVTWDDLREGHRVRFTAIEGQTNRGPRAIEVAVTN